MSTSLPTPITRFVGRARELNELRGLLQTERLITLTGPGGSGKTRLALQLAGEVQSTFRHGVAWCNLAALTDPHLLPQTILQLLDLPADGQRTALDVLLAALRERRQLIVLDNCEQVLAACASLAGALLAECPQLTFLATSLQPLGLPSEKVWPVPPLALSPSSTEGEPLKKAGGRGEDESDAVRLFIDRAHEVVPSFEATAENLALIDAICRRLDGLPLAIELAAVRVKLLSLAQIADRLEDALQLLTRGTSAQIARHQTLRAVLDWSQQLLTPDQQTLFRRLGVFAGSFTLEMIEAVCEVPVALDALSDLVDRSLVLVERPAPDQVRYRLLLVIRQYAREQSEAQGEGERFRSNLLRWLVAWAEAIEPHLLGDDQAVWLQRIEIEQDNWRAALRWACTSRQVEFGLRLAKALVLFWFARYYLTEGRHWLEELLSLEASARPNGSLEATPTLTRAWALWGAGRLAVRQWDDHHAAVRGEESLALFRQLADKAGTIQALNLLALVANDRHNYSQAAALYHEALALSRELGDKYLTAVLLTNQGLMYQEQGEYRQAVPLYEEVLTIMPAATIPAIMTRHNLGELVAAQGDYPRAQQLQEQCLALATEQGNKYGLEGPLLRLGEIAREQHAWERAEQLFNEALALDRQSANPGGIGQALNGLGNVARDRGQLEQARLLYAQSRQHCREAEFTRGSCLATTNLGRIEALQGDDERAADLFRESLQRAHAAGLLHNQIEALEELAGVLVRRGEVRRAVRWLFVSQTWRETMGIPVPPAECERYDAVVRQVQAALDQAALEVIRSQAHTLSLDQVIAEALNLKASGVEPRKTRDAVAATALDPELRIFALGPTRVLVHDRALISTDWTYTKAKELLFYFIAHPPAAKAQIGLDMWPDASADQLRNIFHRALHHLRKALGQPDWIIFANDAYSFNRALNYWCDLDEFKRHLRAAQTADRAQAAQQLDAAIALWRGDFVEDLDAGEWAIFKREELRNRYVRALIDLGALHFADARYDRAVAVYRRLLALDAYLELAHRELMRCLVRQGEVGHALQHHQQLREMLRRELQAEPSPETVMLYERIRRGDEV